MVAAVLGLWGCDKSGDTTTPPDSGDAAPADNGEEEEYGDGAPVLVGDTTEDITKSETLGTQIETTGSLGPDEVNEVVVARMDKVGECYQAAMERTRNQDLEGVVVINFKVGKNGKVTSVEPGAESLGDPETGKCIADMVKTLSFPRPPEGDEVSVRYPFDLKPY